jgi:beta-galactosidase/beta-glucuronidase
VLTRRRMISAGMTALLALSEAEANPLADAQRPSKQEQVSLNGVWLFRPDPDQRGESAGWAAPNASTSGWRQIRVPHTWQTEPKLADFRGVGWYRRVFDAPDSWRNSAVRIHFEAAFHTATVWVNGQPAGEHARKGYTEFAFDITSLLHWGATNIVAVRVDNAFNEHMLPRGRSSDWAHDGGIYRPAELLITPKAYIERVRVHATPDLARNEARVEVTGVCRNTGSSPWTGGASFRVVDEQAGLLVLTGEQDGLAIGPGAVQEFKLEATLPNPQFWHFDHPNLYHLEVFISNGDSVHEVTTTFGVRSFEVKDGQFYLNGKHVRLMGVERMAGSNPEYGMAEPAQLITQDHGDLKHLNCVFTRVHWPQDKRVLDYCDRHGILLQSEVPAWGPATFKGMGNEPDADITENGVEQLREMIARDGNHPSIVVWGLCNEIDGHNPPAFEFARRMLEEAKRLDPHRLCSYASHSLRQSPQSDAARLMDVIETNEYFGSWQPGTPEALARHLDELHATFPGKAIVISEYGYCACTDDRPEGDEHRVRILKSHDEVIRVKDYMSGAIFFCYNDYRTHVGDRGIGQMKQRVHGVVDLYGVRKPSYAVLRTESSPVESMAVENQLNSFQLRLRTRRSLPAYTLSGYKLRGILYGQGLIPIEYREVELPELPPGTEVNVELAFSQSGVPLRVTFDVVRPTGFSAFGLDWKP